MKNEKIGNDVLSTIEKANNILASNLEKANKQFERFGKILIANYNKKGKIYKNYKVNIPSTWADKLKLDIDSRDIKLTLTEDNKIIIEKIDKNI